MNENTKKVLRIVTGVDWVTRTINAAKNAEREVKTITEGDTRAAPESGDQAKRKGKFRVYNPAKDHYFWADDFETALKAAYTDEEIKRMEMNALVMRRILAHGAVFIVVTSIVSALTLQILFPLLSIFPAIIFIPFALRQGRLEETMKQRKLISLDDFLRSPGFVGLWR